MPFRSSRDRSWTLSGAIALIALCLTISSLEGARSVGPARVMNGGLDAEHGPPSPGRVAPVIPGSPSSWIGNGELLTGFLPSPIGARPPPSATLGYSVAIVPSSSVGEVLQTIGLSAETAGSFAPPLIFSWDFGDGTYSNGSSANVSHSYTRAATFVVGVSAVDLVGTRATNQSSIEIHPRLSVQATVAPIWGDAPLVVHGNASVSDGVAPFTYHWVSAGIAASTTADLVTRFQYPGLYSIQLTVRDALGFSADDFWNVTVNRSAGSAIGVSIQLLGVRGGCDGAAQTLSLEAQELNGTPPLTFHWDFGDGETADTGPFVNHTFASYGPYNVSVLVTDSAGFSGNITVPGLDRPHPCATADPGSLALIAEVLGVASAALLTGAWVVLRRPGGPKPPSG